MPTSSWAASRKADDHPSRKHPAEGRGVSSVMGSHADRENGISGFVAEALMNIRRMTIIDYDHVCKLWLSCAGMGLNNLDDSRDGIDRFLKRNPSTCFVAEDKAIIGEIMVGNDGRRGYIDHTAVHPDFRHQGIASQLVDAAIQSLADLGIHKVALVVFDKNEIGNAFWEKQGFTIRHDLVYRNRTLSEMKRIDT